LALLYALPIIVADLWGELGRPSLVGDVEGREVLVRWPRVAMQALAGGLLIATVLTLRSETSMNFIYFAF
jgi:hypothetical protein